jgi:mannose-6-phosphate isomerase-like protein (cupin superfamily)
VPRDLDVETTSRPLAARRRIIVGVTGDGRSTVATDARDIAGVEPLPGYLVQELWNQPSLPGNVADDGVAVGTIDIEPPDQGALVRVLTIDPLAVQDWTPNLHGDKNRHVLTLVSGVVDLILEDEETTLTPGTSVVLSGHVHDWRNTYAEPAVLIYTTFPLGSVSRGTDAD